MPACQFINKTLSSFLVKSQAYQFEGTLDPKKNLEVILGQSTTHPVGLAHNHTSEGLNQ